MQGEADENEIPLRETIVAMMGCTYGLQLTAIDRLLRSARTMSDADRIVWTALRAHVADAAHCIEMLKP